MSTKIFPLIARAMTSFPWGNTLQATDSDQYKKDLTMRNSLDLSQYEGLNMLADKILVG